MSINNPFNIGAGTTGQVVTSNGATTAPSWQNLPTSTAFTSINVQIFTTSGTYTPTANMKYCIVELLGGGGGAGGVGVAASTEVWISASGAAGGYCRKVFDSATIGVSQTVTIGAAGVGGAAGNNPGTTGGTSNFGSFLTANGGAFGPSYFSATQSATGGQLGGTATGGDINIQGQNGFGGFCTGVVLSSAGGSTLYGQGGIQGSQDNGGLNGNNATGYGAGGSGAGSVGASAAASKGGDGSPGLCIVTEFIS